MIQTIEISEKSAALLAEQAAAHGVSIEAWIEALAIEKAQGVGETKRATPPESRSVLDQMRELRSRVTPDPENWTVRDYVEFGRR
jgi:hypothetical protein